MYNHNLIEKKWQKYWLDNKTYQFKDNSTDKKFYALDMFPYPSGQGLHVGHPKGYTATDVISRYKVHQGFNVLHPIGWDAFGLPAEQYALQTGNHPKEFTIKNINHFRNQLQSLGFCFDYDKEVDTTDPHYYKWTQWIFSKLFENGLAEIRDVNVNWCENLGTVLSNEEVLLVDGKMVSERGSHPVVKRPMRQWVLKITQYADKLLEGLNDLDWPESLKSIQRKWIGKSVGAIINFKSNDLMLEVFTTRPDTIYGVSYICIAPEHPYAIKLATSENKKKVEDYITLAKSKTEVSRKENKEKTGVFTGSYAINPISNKKIPIYIADYVLMDYGTGIVMGVPAHDERDYEFAKVLNLPINYVIECKQDNVYVGDGKHINSDLINGLNNKEASKVIINYLSKNKLGKTYTTYKLKDWIFSRQRYWGEPFPIIFDKNNKPYLVKDLPVLLPFIKNIKLSKTGESPLVNDKEWMNVNINGVSYHRESNTMPQWAGSCWYFLGYLLKQPDGSYIDLDSKKAFDIFKKWLPVDLYIGGQEHAVLHLLYARFWHRFLYDIGVVPTKEPFQRIINQGMILGENGEKMSKSRGNVINPDDIVKSHGADALRLYEMFMGPITASLPWTDSGLNGIRKWLDRVYRLFKGNVIEFSDTSIDVNSDLKFAYNNFIKKVSNCIEKYNFNVGISEMMIFINECYKNKSIPKEYLKGFIVVLSCYAPHIAEELWSIFDNKSVFHQPWPKHDESSLVKSTISLPIQENGKLRDVMEISVNESKDSIIEQAKQREKVKAFINNKPIKKVIYVPNKILNFII